MPGGRATGAATNVLAHKLLLLYPLQLSIKFRAPTDKIRYKIALQWTLAANILNNYKTCFTLHNTTQKPKTKKNTENLKIAATITAATMAAAAAAAAAKCNKQFAIKCAAAVKCSDARLIFHYFFGEWPDSHFAAIVFHKSTLTSCCSLYSLQLTAFFRLWAIIQLTRAGIRQISLTFFYFPA